MTYDVSQRHAARVCLRNTSPLLFLISFSTAYVMNALHFSINIYYPIPNQKTGYEGHMNSYMRQDNGFIQA